MNEVYKKQVQLLLKVLPEVAKEKCFAMHGGTAINLFIRNMPRLSVDIDLTFVEIAERAETLSGINSALSRIKNRVKKLSASIRIEQKEEACKLLLDEFGVTVKIEVNTVGRGLLGELNKKALCFAAQEQFDAFCVMPLVSMGQLYGGKLCAALDRQHPRDIFDVMLLMKNEGLTTEIKEGLILGLASSNRPTHEMLNPNLLDQRIAFENQFVGMSSVEFNYYDYEATRSQLIESLETNLDRKARDFLLSLNHLSPDWTIYNYQHYPAVKWKLMNLEKFKNDKPEAYRQQLEKLKSLLG